MGATGLLDYACHRAAKIERTSGTHESLTHLLMSAASGVPVVLHLAFEPTPTVAALSLAAVVTHEAIVIWDVGYAAPLRTVTPTEQHVHSLLEVLPFALLLLSASAHPRAFAGLAHAVPARFSRRSDPPKPWYLALLAALAGTSVVAYAEEFRRCYRVDRTLAPHATPG